jgi:putative protein kinase ArgK-like GTPase of G3E family
MCVSSIYTQSNVHICMHKKGVKKGIVEVADIVGVNKCGKINIEKVL